MSERFKLKDKHIAELRAEIERTGLGLSPFFKRADDVPPLLSENMARNWLSRQTKMASLEHWKWLLSQYRNLADNIGRGSGIRKAHVSERASLKDRLKVRAEFERTGIGGRGIFRHLVDPPEGLTRQACIQAVANPKANREHAHVRALLDTYAQLPDNPYQPLTDETREQLNAEMKRTGLNWPGVYRALGAKAPSDLTAYIIQTWSQQIVKTAQPEYVELVLSTLAELPDDYGPGSSTALHAPNHRKREKSDVPKGHVRITKADFNRLWQYRRETKVSPLELLRNRSDVPKALTASDINAWLYRRKDIVKKEHLSYVLTAYSEASKSLTIS